MPRVVDAWLIAGHVVFAVAARNPSLPFATHTPEDFEKTYAGFTPNDFHSPRLKTDSL